jgi:hypothetical protein
MQLRPFTIILLLAACAPKPSTTDSDAGSSSSATDGASVTSDTSSSSATSSVTSTVTDTAPTSDPGPTTSGASATTVPATASSSPTDTDVGSASATETGGPSGGLPGACSAVCAHWDMCSPGSVGSLADCKAGCIDGFEDPPECTAAITVQWECVADLPCDEALKFLDGDPTSCLSELAVTDEACGFDEPCGGEIGGDMQTCMLEQECGNGKQQYDCDVEQCTCIQDDVPGKQCPSNDFCSSSHEEQIAALTACCGWDWGF